MKPWSRDRNHPVQPRCQLSLPSGWPSQERFHRHRHGRLWQPVLVACRLQQWGAAAPYSRNWIAWDDASTPIKPEVIFEAGITTSLRPKAGKAQQPVMSKARQSSQCGRGLQRLWPSGHSASGRASSLARPSGPEACSGGQILRVSDAGRLRGAGRVSATELFLCSLAP
jgi:hypothetical protein